MYTNPENSFTGGAPIPFESNATNEDLMCQQQFNYRKASMPISTQISKKTQINMKASQLKNEITALKNQLTRIQNNTKRTK
jgi:polyhydroxyalkanoate synthesis regulator phasin